MDKVPTAEILSLFWNTGRRLRQQLTYRSPVSHLTLAQLELLKLIADKGQVSMKDVADCQAVTPPSATVMVNHLVRLKLLARRPDTQDRRGISLNVTKKGALVFQKAQRQQQKELHKLLQHVSVAERTQLARILKKMSPSMPSL